MNLLIGMGVAVLLAAGVSAYGVVIGRRGTSKPHRTAFVAGLAGLVAVPLWMLGLAGLFSQLFWADMTSPLGLLFLSMSTVLLVTLLSIAWARLRLRTGHDRA